jgi:hypothetical protein
MGLCDARLQQPDVILKLNLEVIAAEPADAANTPFGARSMSNEVALFMCHFHSCLLAGVRVAVQGVCVSGLAVPLVRYI